MTVGGAVYCVYAVDIYERGVFGVDVAQTDRVQDCSESLLRHWCHENIELYGCWCWCWSVLPRAKRLVVVVVDAGCSGKRNGLKWIRIASN